MKVLRAGHHLALIALVVTAVCTRAAEVPEIAAPLHKMEAPLLDRNYYTAEAEAVARCRFALPGEVLKQHRLVARHTDGNVLAEVKRVRAETFLRIPIRDLPIGNNRVSISLQKKGAVLTEQKVVLLKRKPKPGSEVKIDRFNRIALKDGKPFMPFGMLCGKGEEHFRLLAEHGFNTVSLQTWYGGPEDAKPAMENAAKHSLAVIDRYWNYIGRRQTIQEGRDVIAAGIKAVRDYPNLLGYWSVDEPNVVAGHAGSFDKVMEDCRLLYESVNEHDGYHPVCMLYARHIPSLPKATAWADVLAFDVYLTGGMKGLAATPAAMARDVARLEQRAAAANSVTWVVPLAETLGAGRCARGLLPQEHRSQAYMALINGAKGLLYFQYSLLSHSQSWGVFRELSEQMEILSPAILSPPVPRKITYTPGPCDPANGKITGVQVALFKAGRGRHILLAANCRDHPLYTIFTIPALGRTRAVNRLFADESFPVRKHKFSDRLEWCGVRAYELDLRDTDDGEIDIHVDMKALPQRVPAEGRTNPKTARIGKKNAMPNASFETQTLQGCPDHVFPIRLDGRPAIGDPGAPFVLDPQKPFHGKHSLRVTYRPLTDIPSCLGASLAAYPSALDAPTHYTLSLYMRSDKDGAQVQVKMDNLQPGETTFALTKTWQRYSMGGMLQVERRRHKTLSVVPVGHGTTVWLDALQFETGAKPTEFTVD